MKKIKKIINKIMIRVFGHIPFPKEHEYKKVEFNNSIFSFYVKNLNCENNF